MAKDPWLNKLTNQQYRVLRLKQTEAPFSGRLLSNKQAGTYVCAGCGNILFDSSTKFDSKTGWPSFNQPVNKRAIKLSEDRSFGMRRVEISCQKCGGHLGHVFHDAPDQPTGMRFCINSAALEFKKSRKLTDAN